MTLCFYSEAPISENPREKNAILRWDSGNLDLAGQSQPVGIQDLDLAGKVTSTREPKKTLGLVCGSKQVKLVQLIHKIDWCSEFKINVQVTGACGIF